MRIVLCCLMSVILLISVISDSVLVDGQDRNMQDYMSYILSFNNENDSFGIKEMTPNKEYSFFPYDSSTDNYMANTSQTQYMVTTFPKAKIEVQTEQGCFGLEIENEEKFIALGSECNISFHDDKLRLDVPVKSEKKQGDVSLIVTPPEGGFLEHWKGKDESINDFVTISNAEGVIIGFITRNETVDSMKYKFTLEDNKVVITTRAEDNPEPGGANSIIIQGTNYYFSDFFSSGIWINRAGFVTLSLTRRMQQWDVYYVQLFGLNESLMAAQTWSLIRSRFQYSPEWILYNNSQGLYEQYVCHVFNAINKNPFNLEPARPAVGYPLTVLTGCNP